MPRGRRLYSTREGARAATAGSYRTQVDGRDRTRVFQERRWVLETRRLASLDGIRPGVRCRRLYRRLYRSSSGRSALLVDAREPPTDNRPKPTARKRLS